MRLARLVLGPQQPTDGAEEGTPAPRAFGGHAPPAVEQLGSVALGLDGGNERRALDSALCFDLRLALRVRDRGPLDAGHARKRLLHRPGTVVAGHAAYLQFITDH